MRSALIAALALAGCAGMEIVNAPGTPAAASATLRQAEDTPSRFVREDGSAPASTVCANPMVDPRNGDRLRLVRQPGGQQADYAVPVVGLYGVRGGELLRLNCTTGRPVGIVRT